MLYNEIVPADGAADAIRALWSLTGTSNTTMAEPIVSDGCAEIVINVGDQFEDRQPDGTFARQPRAMVVGPTAHPVFARPGRSVHVVGVRLQPWATAAVTGVPATELRDRIVPLDDVSPVMRRFGVIVLDEVSHGASLSRLQRLLTATAVRADLAASTTRPLIEAIRGSRDPLSVRVLAEALGRSVRSLQRTFRHDVGLGPRTILRITRVQRALRLAALHPNRSWLWIAARAGYYDQPHFVREFRELVGLSPSEYRADDDSLTASFVEREYEGVSTSNEQDVPNGG